MEMREKKLFLDTNWYLKEVKKTNKLKTNRAVSLSLSHSVSLSLPMSLFHLLHSRHHQIKYKALNALKGNKNEI